MVSGLWLCLMLTVGVRLANADSPQLLSARNTAVPLPTAANGESTAPWISADGRFVLFSSSANDLVTNDNGYLGLDAFLHDRVDKTTRLVSVNTNGSGANGYSVGEQVSTNGRFVLIQSDASDLLPGDTNEVSDIFVRDLQLAANLQVSVAADGGWGNGAATEPVMTPDGRWVAFVSAATNLVAGDTNGIPDLFLRDLVNGTTKWVTAGATGANSVVSSPLITPDGRYLAFFSTAKRLATGVPVTTRGEIYLYDAVLNQMTWVSTNASVTTSNILRLNSPPSYHPALSDDGRFVAFKCGWTNGTAAPPSPGKAAALVFLFDAFNQSATVLTTNAQAAWPFNDDVYGPEITPDGRFVAYVEREAIGTATPCGVRLWDQQTGTNVLVSADLGGLLPTNSVSHTPTVSADGRYVIFLSDATNLVANAITNGLHIYRRDLQTSTTALVDVDTNGIGSSVQMGDDPVVSSTGDLVVYSSIDGGLVGLDNNEALDVFLWDSTTGTNELISPRDPQVLSRSGNGVSAVGQLSFSANGAAVAFASYASDLTADDSNRAGDVFVNDLTGNSNTLVSLGLAGQMALGGTSHSPAISGDGRYVAFVSAATNLVANDTNLASDVFRRDLLSASTVLVGVNASGFNLGNGDASQPVVSQDGRYVAFLCRTNLAVAQTGVFWRDVDSGLTRLVSGNAYSDRMISLSADGQRVAYFDNQARLYVWDAGLATNIYTNTTSSLTSAAISPGGNKVLYQSFNQLSVRDLAFSTNQFLYSTTVPIKSQSQWSGDGRYVAFVTRSNLVAGDNNGINDVYLRDLQTGTLSLLSLNQGGTASGNGPSELPEVSADGRFIAYRTLATDIVPGVVKPPAIVRFDRATGSNALLVAGTTGNGRSSWVSRPSLSSNGARLAFQSWDAGLAAGDLNQAADAFAGSLDFLSTTDTDGDGVPDWWLNQYFGHANGQAGDESRAADDADDDGSTNLEEFLAGTNPTSSSSVLAVRIARGVGNVTLNWDATAGRNYQVLTTADLGNPDWQTVPSGVAVIGGQGYFTVSAAEEQRFFRIVCGN